MAKSINQVILMGRLTRDPELRTTTTGKSVVNFSLAVDKGGQDAGADFFEIVAWEKLAELIQQYLSKGRRCLVQGRLSQRQWEQDGQKRSRIEVMASDVTFLDGPNSGSDGAGAPASQPASPAPQADAVVDDEIDLSDIPF
jgi:single-strand binding protein